MSSRVAAPILAMALAVAACSTVGTETSPEGGDVAPTVRATPSTAAGPTPTVTPPASTDAWTEAARMGTARSEMPAAVVGGLVYVPGGFVRDAVRSEASAVVEVLDPATGDWALAPDIPRPRHHLMAAADGDTLHVFGGYDPATVDTAWRLAPGQGSWESVAPLPEPVGAASAVSLGDFVYVVGGTPNGDTLLRYDPANDVWADLAPLARPREHVAAVALDGEVWVLAGRWVGAGEMASIEIYHPDGDEWRAGPDMIDRRSGHGATVHDRTIVVAGGERVMDDLVVLRSAETYDPRTGRWTSLPDLPQALHGLPLASAGDRVYAMGGSVAAGAISNLGRVFVLEP